MKRSVMLALVVSSLVQAETPPAGRVKDGKVVKSARDEISRLQHEVDEQRALLIRILELQQQQYTALLKLAKGEAGSAEAVLPAEAPPAAPARAAAVEPAEAAPEPSRPARGAPAPARPAAQATATVTGKVTVSGSSGPAWVFIEDVKGTAEGAFEIKQEDKQFIPRIAAVPKGTKLLFANADNIFHNVFSVSPGNAFDIGNTRSGEAPRGYTAVAPGVIDLFCNLHAKMSASVLVTPGPLLAKVQPDGSFKLDNVPLGSHRIGAWAGGAKITSKDVEVGAGGATVSFQVAAGESGPHKNKTGQSYGSYAD